MGGATSRYVYDDRRVMAILDGDNNLVALFTNGPGIDSPLVMRRSGSDYFYHADALGNVNALTDTNGNVVETVSYQAYGKAVVKDAAGDTHEYSTVASPFLFASREHDAEMGRHYLRARYYDAEIGRFLSEDPIPSINPFPFAGNNPVLYTDPLGLYAVHGGREDSEEITRRNIGTVQDIRAVSGFLYPPPFDLSVRLGLFGGLVAPGGLWDYKMWPFADEEERLINERFGNENYGETGAALLDDLPDLVADEILLNAAGIVQIYSDLVRSERVGKPKRLGRGLPFISVCRGDQCDDQIDIMRGIRNYRSKYRGEDLQCP